MKPLLAFFLLVPSLAFGQMIVPSVTIGQVTPSPASGGPASFSSITDTGLTAGRVVYTGTGGLLSDSANLAWFNATSHLVLGGGADGTAVVQLASADGAANGISIGDVFIFRQGSQIFRFTAGSGFLETNSGSGNPRIEETTGNASISWNTAGSITINPSGSIAVTIDSSNASFVGGIITTTIGKTLSVKSGSNAKAGTFTLTGGAATVANTSITANSVVVIMIKTVSGTRTGSPYVATTTPATGFTLAGGTATDNGTYNYIVLEVN